jgi:4-hydroxymandelate oxidase
VKPEGLDADDTRLARLDDEGELLNNVFNLSDFEPLARRSMASDAFDYYAGGAGDEISLRANVASFARWRLSPRVLVDVSSIDISTEILGTRVAMPVGLAPTALQRLAHPEGEVATARAAAATGVVFCLSTLGSRTIEDVAEAAGKPVWFQLYVHKDGGVSRSLIQRAEASGFDALVVTVDLPVVGYRERDLRNHFAIAPELYGNLVVAGHEGRELHELVQSLSDRALTWDDLSWIRDTTSLPIVIKGILTAEDAVLAAEHGADAIVVSNHGARQLDRTAPAIDVLEEVVEAVDGRLEVYMDGGVRRGTDVVTALALGARAVFIGRPYLFALAAAGQRGLERALGLMAAELENAMALLGAPDVGAVSRANVERVSS